MIFPIRRMRLWFSEFTIICFFLLIFPIVFQYPVFAGDVPTNDQLFQMIKELQTQVSVYKAEAEKAKAEARKARVILDKLKKILISESDDPPVTTTEAPTQQATGTNETAPRTALKMSPSGNFLKDFDPMGLKVETKYMKFSQEGGVTDYNGNKADFESSTSAQYEAWVKTRNNLGLRGRYWRFDERALCDINKSNYSEVDTYIADVEIFKQLKISNTTGLDFSIGARYTDFSQALKSGTTIYKGNFNGVGPVVGITAKQDIGFGKLYARSRLGIMVGEMDIKSSANESKANDNTASQLEIGGGYELSLPLWDWGQLSFNFGVEYQYWSNIAMADSSFGGVGNDDVLEDGGFFGILGGAALEF